MRRYPKKGGQFAIIWVDLLYEDSVPQSAKILFGEIYRLSDAEGWCDASNQDFMDLLGCSETTVRNLLKSLEGVGQIRIVTEPNRAGKGGTKRRIFCARKLAPVEPGRVPAENCGTRKNLRGVPAENCGSTNSKSNKESNTPLPPKGGGTRKRPEPKATADWNPERFEAFWVYYRTNVRPENRQAAIRAWDKLQPDDELIARIGRALQKQLQTQAWKDGIGIPYASTYLNNARWEDAEGLPDPPAETVPKEAYGWQQ